MSYYNKEIKYHVIFMSIIILSLLFIINKGKDKLVVLVIEGEFFLTGNLSLKGIIYFSHHTWNIITTTVSMDMTLEEADPFCIFLGCDRVILPESHMQI